MAADTCVSDGCAGGREGLWAARPPWHLAMRVAGGCGLRLRDKALPLSVPRSLKPSGLPPPHRHPDTLRPSPGRATCHWPGRPLCRAPPTPQGHSHRIKTSWPRCQWWPLRDNTQPHTEGLAFQSRRNHPYIRVQRSVPSKSVPQTQQENKTEHTWRTCARTRAQQKLGATRAWVQVPAPPPPRGLLLTITPPPRPGPSSARGQQPRGTV